MERRILLPTLLGGPPWSWQETISSRRPPLLRPMGSLFWIVLSGDFVCGQKRTLGMLVPATRGISVERARPQRSVGVVPGRHCGEEGFRGGASGPSDVRQYTGCMGQERSSLMELSVCWSHDLLFIVQGRTCWCPQARPSNCGKVSHGQIHLKGPSTCHFNFC